LRSVAGADTELRDMTVPSFPFLLLVLAGAIAFNLFNSRWWRAAVFLIVNLFMIQTFASNLMLFAPYAGFLILGYVGVVARRRGIGWARWAFPVLVLLSFVWLKRYLFIPHAILISSPYVAVGLSYVFFRVLHLVIDGWEEAPKGAEGLISYVNYTLNFTSLVSGPIQRYEDYREQEVAPGHLDIAVVGKAVERIVVGFFKVYIVSSLLQTFQHGQLQLLSADQTALGQTEHLAIIIATYPIFLFFNFSGYTDFVIGCAKLFRLELPENFDRPFSSLNFIDFWSRWHITLSQWLKTYVYSPFLLAAMRRAPSDAAMPWLSVMAYFVTFFLVGAWHGQTMEFLFFGILQGGGVATNKLYQEVMARWLGQDGYAKLSDNPLYQAIARGVTFTWFAFTLLWFWSTWREMGVVFGRVGLGETAVAILTIAVAATIALSLLSAATTLFDPEKGRVGATLRTRYARTAYATALIVIVLVANFVVSAPAPQLVYKAF
jgi:alginate O-acetyltransferase complex protein AlgI